MKIREIDDLVANGTHVIVREWNGEEIFSGIPFMGGFEVDPNINAWRSVLDEEIYAIASVVHEQNEWFTTPAIMIWIWRAEK